MFNVVLFEPEIPQNTGNIARTCAATGCRLHLIEPLGFKIEDKYLKRAGLDYWPLVEVITYKNIDEFYEKNPEVKENIYYLTTKGSIRYDKVSYKEGDYFMFGPETRGLPEELLHDNYGQAVRIPMIEEARSLNLSNSVAIVVYEAVRQTDAAGLLEKGHLTKF
ncbi:MAG: tRNA (uridine(34)/cytosine(34)/5-carboxymethylaminomethyluridine(34)-2'-O)-methyltransferase TrmL [Clostridia bacterium]|nr:tRNA (uridine(34)/cytosine(34)/5-carboxymethylaminomethyluridine(34)-2'-O)-methyltransferase TrmL [Clostridia bacterium]